MLSKVYAALELPFDEASVGAVADESRSVRILELEQAIIEALASHATTRPSRQDTATQDLARELLPHHRVG